MEKTKKCSHCQKEIPSNAKRCSYCQADLRNWFVRHKILTLILVLIAIGIYGSISKGNEPSLASQNATTNNTVDTLLTQNHPTIKELVTTPKDYVGKSFTLYAYAKDTRYYNYGFDDEGKYYSFELTDNSSSGIFDSVYSYVVKNAQSQDLVNRALNDQVLIKAQVSIPTDKWQDGSNAFLQIDSWEYQ